MRIEKLCPKCNAEYEESCFSDTAVRCAYCGLEISFRTPLQKRRESVLLKYETLSLKHWMVITMVILLVFCLPILFYVFFTETPLSMIFDMHPVAFIIYCAILLMFLITLLYVITFSISFAFIKKNTDYELDKLKTYNHKNKWHHFFPFDFLIKKVEESNED